MYYLNKIAGWMISPMGVALVGFVLTLVCHVLGKRKIGRCLFALSLVWLWIWATPLMSRIVGASLEREFLVDGKVPTVDSFPKADAILLLGGSMGYEGDLGGHSEMWTSADRVWRAAELYKAGKAPVIHATGGGVKSSTGKLLADFGVPPEAVVFDESPRNTEEEARAAARRGERKVLVVTSAWHMKRARMMFEKYAPEVEIVPAPRDFENTMGASGAWSPLELLPSPPSLMWNSVTFHEWLGIIGYTLFRR